MHLVDQYYFYKLVFATDVLLLNLSWAIGDHMRMDTLWWPTWGSAPGTPMWPFWQWQWFTWSRVDVLSGSIRAYSSATRFLVMGGLETTFLNSAVTCSTHWVRLQWASCSLLCLHSGTHTHRVCTGREPCSAPSLSSSVSPDNGPYGTDGSLGFTRFVITKTNKSGSINKPITSTVILFLPRG